MQIINIFSESTSDVSTTSRRTTVTSLMGTFYLIVAGAILAVVAVIGECAIALAREKKRTLKKMVCHFQFIIVNVLIF